MNPLILDAFFVFDTILFKFQCQRENSLRISTMSNLLKKTYDDLPSFSPSLFVYVLMSKKRKIPLYDF